MNDGDSKDLTGNSIPGRSPVEPDAIDAAWADVEQALSRPSDTPAPPNSEPTLQADSPPGPTSFSPLVMVETAFLASAASLIWLVNFYFPIGPVLRVFFPVPIALIYLRRGQRAAWMGCFVAGLLLAVLMGPPRSLLYIMPYGLMGVLLGCLWQRRATWLASVGITTLLGAFGFFFRIWLTSLLLGDDLWLYATTQVTRLIDWVCLKLGILFQPSLLTIQAVLTGMIVLNSIVYVFVVHLVAWFLLDRLGNPIPRPPKWVQVLMEYEE